MLMGLEKGLYGGNVRVFGFQSPQQSCDSCGDSDSAGETPMWPQFRIFHLP